MTEDMKKVLEEILKASPQDKVRLAASSLDTVIDNLKKSGVPENNRNTAILNLTKLFVSADSNCSPHEWSFFKAVTGIEISYDDFYNITNGGSDPKFIADAVEFLKSLDEETRNAAITYGIAILASDLTYAETEIEIIDKLLSVESAKTEKGDSEIKVVYEKSMEITEDILKNCVVIGDENATYIKINQRLHELTDAMQSPIDAKAIFLTIKKLEELSFAQLEEIRKAMA